METSKMLLVRESPWGKERLDLRLPPSQVLKLEILREMKLLEDPPRSGRPTLPILRAQLVITLGSRQCV